MRYKGHNNDHALSKVAKDRICLFLLLHFPSSWYYAFSQYGMRWKKFGTGVGGNSLDFVIVKSTGYVCQLVLDGDTSWPQ